MSENTNSNAEVGDSTERLCTFVSVDSRADVHITSLSAILNKEGAPVGYFGKHTSGAVLFCIVPEASDSYDLHLSKVTAKMDAARDVQIAGVTMPAPFGLDPA